MAEDHDFEPLVLNSVQARNDQQKHRMFQMVTERFGHDLRNQTFGLWGLAFKPGTDDMREAPSVILLESLIGAGAKVRGYDPAAIEAARQELPAAWFESGQLVLAEDQYDALRGVDALLLVTEWKSFRHPNFSAMKRLMNLPIILDGRNLYDPLQVRDKGFEYRGIGR
jgi:UDPglucose 6-dehydrogenase